MVEHKETIDDIVQELPGCPHPKAHPFLDRSSFFGHLLRCRWTPVIVHNNFKVREDQSTKHDFWLGPAVAPQSVDNTDFVSLTDAFI